MPPPRARRDRLLTQPVGDELVLYDERTHHAHRLNRTAALVWRLADGRRSTSEIAGALQRAADTPAGEDLIRLTLAELATADLLATSLPDAGEIISRRHLFKIATALVPAIASIATPDPANAQLCFSPNGQPTVLCPPGSGSPNPPTSNPGGYVLLNCVRTTPQLADIDFGLQIASFPGTALTEAWVDFAVGAGGAGLGTYVLRMSVHQGGFNGAQIGLSGQKSVEILASLQPARGVFVFSPAVPIAAGGLVTLRVSQITTPAGVFHLRIEGLAEGCAGATLVRANDTVVGPAPLTLFGFP